MPRLDQDRQNSLEPKRMERAIEAIEGLGYYIIFKNDSVLSFFFKGDLIRFFPYSGWASGKSIKDGRGLDKLLKQIKKH